MKITIMVRFQAEFRFRSEVGCAGLELGRKEFLIGIHYSGVGHRAGTGNYGLLVCQTLLTQV